jgi:hypothetical protein
MNVAPGWAFFEFHRGGKSADDVAHAAPRREKSPVSPPHPQNHRHDDRERKNERFPVPLEQGGKTFWFGRRVNPLMIKSKNMSAHFLSQMI